MRSFMLPSCKLCLAHGRVLVIQYMLHAFSFCMLSRMSATTRHLHIRSWCCKLCVLKTCARLKVVWETFTVPVQPECMKRALLGQQSPAVLFRTGPMQACWELN